MTDLSPVIPKDCDTIVVNERFVNEGVKFTGTEYRFIFKKRFSVLGVECNRILKTDVIRSDLFLRTEDVELSGKPSLNEFQEFVKDWKLESKGANWTSMDHTYTKEVQPSK